MNGKELENMISAYIECALWSSMDNANDQGGEPLDANYTEEDIDTATLAEMRQDCLDFVDGIPSDLLADYLDTQTAEQMGHDFWLTRNGHGAGFWDRGLGNIGDTLTDFAKAYGECDLYVGDDGRIYA